MSQFDCPRCSTNSLLRSNLGCLCSECEGCWLDFEQFEKVLHLSDLELSISSIEPTLVADTEGVELEERIVCPRCQVRMKRHIYMLDSGVTIDLCRAHGMWLDDGELVKIRTYLSEIEHQQPSAPEATGVFSFFRRIFGSTV